MIEGRANNAIHSLLLGQHDFVILLVNQFKCKPLVFRMITYVQKDIYNFQVLQARFIITQ